MTTAAHGAFTGTFTVLTVPLIAGLAGGREPNMGDLVCIASAVIFGLHKWRTEKVTARFQDDTKELMALQLGVLAAGSLLWVSPSIAHTFADGGLPALAHGLQNLPWVPLAYMGIFTTALTLWIE